MECLICRRSTVSRLEPKPGWREAFQCALCGPYLLDGYYYQLLAEDSIPLSAVERGRLCVLIRTMSDLAGGPAQLDHVRMDELLADARRERSHAAIADDVLLRLTKKLPQISDTVSIPDTDSPSFGAPTLDDLYGYLEYLEAKQWVSLGLKNADLANSIRLTIDGWQRVEELRRGGAGARQAFVAMWFTDEMAAVYTTAIAPAIGDAGFLPLKIDLVEHNEDIVDRIIAGIRASAFLVADYTGGRQGVYYEAGFARGLGLQVINSCQKDHFDDLHFDIEHTNCIKWTAPEELYERLLNRIRATIPNARHGR